MYLLKDWLSLSNDEQIKKCQDINPYENWDFFKEIEEKLKAEEIKGVDSVFCGLGNSLGSINSIVVYIKKGIRIKGLYKYYLGFPVIIQRYEPIEKIEFINLMEVRMGSPFKVCDIKFNGIEKSIFQKYEWQNIYSSKDEHRSICFIRWNIDENNNPGFNVILYNSVRDSFTEFDRIEGCCTAIKLENDYIYWENHKNENGKIWLTTAST